MNYASLLREIGASSQIVSAHEGEITVPKYTLTAPFKAQYGYPPAIIPLWSNADWPGYIGVVLPWFGGAEYEFVKIYSDSGFMSEIALSFDQLSAWLAFDFLCNVPDAHEVGEFAESIGLCSKDDVENYFRDCKDQHDLIKLPVFKDRPPRILTEEAADGRPAWILPKTSKNEIINFIDQGDLRTAWYGINSLNFRSKDVDELIDYISLHSKNAHFLQLVECWRENSHLWRE
jgi:hypothetical protein